METLKLFMLAFIGSFGFMELTDYSLADLVPDESLELVIKSILSLLAGILATFINRLLKRKDRKQS